MHRQASAKQANAIDAHVGRQIRARRTLIGMSQEKRANQLGYLSAIQKYETGVNRIGAGRLFEFAKVLGCSIAYFYQGVIHGSPSVEICRREGHLPSPLAPREGEQLSAAFARIPDIQLRWRILELVKGLAKDARGGR